MSLRRLSTHAELLDASGGDAFVRYAVPAELSGPAFALGDAVVTLRRTPTRRLGLAAVGAPADVETLVGEVVASGALDGLALRHVTVARGGLDGVGRHLPLGPGNEWEWMYAAEPPAPVGAESRLVPLGEEDLPEIAALLAQANPRTEARPFESPGQRWVGVRDGRGRLLACGMCEPNLAGHPLLAGITVRADERGRGLGLAVTAHLTREAVEEAGVCTLGMYSDNPVARRVYQGLGYGGAHHWSSSRVLAR